MEYKQYDIAFSYLTEDEEFVGKIKDEFRDTSVKIFFYKDHRDKIIGEDGKKYYYDIFNKHSKVVVIFYRNGWGVKGMTIYEKRGIDDRDTLEGDEFYLLIPTVKNFVIPTGYSKNKIRADNFSNDHKSAFDDIINFYKQKGNEINVNEIKFRTEEKIRKIIGTSKMNDDKYELLHGLNLIGLENANNNFDELLKSICEMVKKFGFNDNIKNRGNAVSITINRFIIIFSWWQTFSNTLDGSHLDVVIRVIQGRDYGDSREFEEPHRKTYEVDIKDDKYGWKDKDSKGNFISNDELIDEWLPLYFNMISKS